VASLVVSNTGNQSVSWIVGDGELSAAVPTLPNTNANLLNIEGVASVQVLGSTGNNTLTTISSGPTQGTINGNHVTLVSGQNVLQQSNFNTYENFSDSNHVTTFAGLTSTASSYTYSTPVGSFQVNGNGSNLVPSTTSPGAVGASSTSANFTLE